jgi:hypothetical protein
VIRPAVKPRWVAVMVVAGAVFWVLGANQAAALRSGRPLLREFMAFYTVGWVLNRSPEALYNPDSFERALVAWQIFSLAMICAGFTQGRRVGIGRGIGQHAHVDDGRESIRGCV